MAHDIVTASPPAPMRLGAAVPRPEDDSGLRSHYVATPSMAGTRSRGPHDKGVERVVKAGEGFHIDASLVHRGQAGASGAKVLVVRLKPKDKPIMQMVPHTD
jgi:hypothetical protein